MLAASQKLNVEIYDVGHRAAIPVWSLVVAHGWPRGPELNPPWTARRPRPVFTRLTLLEDLPDAVDAAIARLTELEAPAAVSFTLSAEQARHLDAWVHGASCDAYRSPEALAKWARTPAGQAAAILYATIEALG